VFFSVELVNWFFLIPTRSYVPPQLQMDIDRLPHRNLGRDDRIISSHGVETRFPYLSMSIVDYIASLPIHYKIGTLSSNSPGGLADKIILRSACLQAGRKKRAMQFGTRSARMEMEEGEIKGRGARGVGTRKVV
jgi:asparagine synthetase B (glutamine-hydrolysing)